MHFRKECGPTFADMSKKWEIDFKMQSSSLIFVKFRAKNFVLRRKLYAYVFIGGEREGE